MTQIETLKILFVLNPNSGNNNTDWSRLITDYFTPLHHDIEIYEIPKACDRKTLEDKIKSFAPQLVVAVGGDGTVKLVAECLLKKDILLGILPAGSANGLAGELGIGNDPAKALDILVAGHSQKLHATLINDHLCIHLSDIGLNAYAIKRFETQQRRGMWGYLIATLRVLWQNPLLDIDMKVDGQTIHVQAEMIVIANATKYGSGVVINPVGKLDDHLFEVVVIKKISVLEILKMIFRHNSFNPDKTELFQTDTLHLRSSKNVHFQVDGEYLGKIKQVKAAILPDALEVIVPAPAG